MAHGEFVMIGLPNQDGKPILRAYSIASPSWSEEVQQPVQLQ